MLKNLIFALVITLGVSSCGVPADDPGAVAKEFFVRLGQLNFNGAAELATEKSKSMILMMGSFLSSADEEQKKEMEEQKKFAAANPPKVVDTKIDGNTATVTLAIQDENQEVQLEKVDGKWKVNFNKNM